MPLISDCLYSVTMDARSAEAFDPSKGATTLRGHPYMEHWSSWPEGSACACAVYQQADNLQALPAEILVIVPSGKRTCNLRDIRHGLAIT